MPLVVSLMWTVLATVYLPVLAFTILECRRGQDEYLNPRRQ